MAAAVALTDWHKAETRRVYALLGESDEQAELRRLLEWIDRRGGAVTVRELQQGRREYGTADAAETALQPWRLAAMGPGRTCPRRPRAAGPIVSSDCLRCLQSTQPPKTPKKTGVP